MDIDYIDSSFNEIPGSVMEMYRARGIELSKTDYRNILFNILNQPGVMIIDKIYSYDHKKALYPANVLGIQEQLHQFVQCVDIGLKLGLTKPQVREIYKYFCQLVISSNPESTFAKKLIKEYDIPGLNLNDSFTKARTMLEQSLEPEKYAKHKYILKALDEWIFENNYKNIYPVFTANLLTPLRHNPLTHVLSPLLDGLTLDIPTPYNATNDLVVRQFTKYVNKKVTNHTGAHVVFKTLERLKESTPYLPIVRTLTVILADRIYQLETTRKKNFLDTILKLP